MQKTRIGRTAALLVTLVSVPFSQAADAPPTDRLPSVLFRAAENAWSRQKWSDAIAGFKQAADQFPNDPVGIDAQCHYAECLSFVAPPEVSMAEYEKVLQRAPGSHEAHEARCGIAALKYWLGDLDGAQALFRQVARETKDWATLKECIGRIKHLQREMDLERAQPNVGAKDCGPKAMAELCRLKGIPLAGAELSRLLPMSKDGVTFEAMRRAVRAKGLKAVGARLDGVQLQTAAKPFIAHLRNHHYLVVTDVRGARIDYIDPHGRATYTTTNRFHVLWDGTSLVEEKGVPGLRRRQLLGKPQMEQIRGGHHLHGNEDGGCEENPASGCDQGNDNCGGGSPGLPMWQVNMGNYNFLVRDLVFTYDGLGPTAQLRLTYSADSSLMTAFGRSWTHNYNIFLSENPNGVDVRRGGAKLDHFVSRGDGTYDPPLWNHDELLKNTNTGTYTLQLKVTKETQHFDANGRLTRIEDRNGLAITFGYEDTRLRTITDAAGRVTTLNYHPSGLVSEVIDPLGRHATYHYDAVGNLTTYIDMAGNAITYSYDSISYMTSYSTPRGTWQIRRGTTPNFSDLPYILREVIDPLGRARSYDTGPTIAWYDDERTNRWFVFSTGAGQTTQFTDPASNRWSRAFNGAGDLTSFTDPEGRYTSYSYDTRGNRTRVEVASGNYQQFAYDMRDNVTNILGPLGRSTRYSYDSKDNLTSTTDALGQRSSVSYDALGQVVAITDPRTNAARFSYDSRGNLTAITNAVGGVTRFTHDNVGRVATVTDAKSQTLTFTHDALDRLQRVDLPGGQTREFNYACCSLTSIQDPSGTLGFDVDATGQLLHFTNTFGQVIGYEYDPAGNLTHLTYPGNKVVLYRYDVANRLTAVTDWLGNTTHYAYDRSSKLNAATNANGTVTLYSYNYGGQLTTLLHQRPGGELIAGWRLSYDPADRLTSAVRIAGTPVVAALTNATFTYDANNRLATGPGTTFTHDANGNLAGLSGAQATTLRYDALDRLTNIQRGATATFYSYDGLGQRVGRTAGATTTRYLLDPRSQFNRVLMETDAVGNPLAYYVHGIGLVAKITPAGQSYAYHFDWIGNTVAMTDAAATAVNRYNYDPLGNVTSNSVETVANVFRFVGRFGVMDDGTGLFYMKARYYLPGVGRFISKDPAGSFGGQNYYAYALNSPLNYIDPLGLWYIDLGFSLGSPWGGGVAYGFFFGPNGVNPYAGGGVMTPGPGVSLMWSPGSPSPGCWSVQVAGGYGVGGAAGYGGGSPFWEVGLSTPGASAITYYTW